MRYKAQARQDQSWAGAEGREGRERWSAESVVTSSPGEVVLTLGKGQHILDCCGAFRQMVSKLYAGTVGCVTCRILDPCPKSGLKGLVQAAVWALLQDLHAVVRDKIGVTESYQPVIWVIGYDLHSYIYPLLAVPRLENPNPVFPRARHLVSKK